MKKKNDGRIVKKSEGIRKEGIFAKGKPKPKYLTIQYFKQKQNWSIDWMSQKRGVLMAGYYKWLHRERTEK